jgi:hypothetical protein
MTAEECVGPDRYWKPGTVMHHMAFCKERWADASEFWEALQVACRLRASIGGTVPLNGMTAKQVRELEAA